MQKYLVAILICLFLVLTIGCKRQQVNPHSDVDSLLMHLEEGDLLFRRGTGFVGHVVTMADTEGRYSHVGIVVYKDSVPYIVHAVPHEHDFEGDFDRVKCEDARSFIGRYTECVAGIYRLQVSDSLKSIAANHALRLSEKQIPFDHDYNLDDTTALYCTELIEYVYGLVGISISEGRRTDVSLPGMRGEYIMPSDLTKCSKLEVVATM
ncbi:MAG: hypothetical protein J6R28_08460 [Bacteroides sp.]|nr:hypothetical protein [Bacteroides sp.]